VLVPACGLMSPVLRLLLVAEKEYFLNLPEVDGAPVIYCIGSVIKGLKRWLV
jgi:hypothetical protein